jgi:hypothetical protein
VQIGKVSVTRSMSDVEQYTWTVLFDTNLGDLPLMDIDFGAVTGSLPTCGVTQSVKGVVPSFASGPGGLSEGSAIVTDMDSLRYTITGLRQVSGGWWGWVAGDTRRPCTWNAQAFASSPLARPRPRPRPHAHAHAQPRVHAHL